MTTLEAITAPTLALAGDHNVIRDEHTVDIYHHLADSQLVVFLDATHMVPFDDPALFNATVERFFRTPFVIRRVQLGPSGEVNWRDLGAAARVTAEQTNTAERAQLCGPLTLSVAVRAR